MHIPFFSFEHMNRDLGDAPHAAFKTFWEKQWYILGDEVRLFEQEYAAWNGTKHCIGVANGLDALVLALRALNIGPGDEVIVPSNTYIASWLAVTQTGATPIPVEPDPATCNIEPNRIESAITPRTKAIMPVHLYGLACEMQAIMDIAQRHQLWVVEDNAQGHNAWHNGKKTGAWGHINATSFYPTKNLGALGDAGAVTTDDDDLAQRIRLLRNYGSGQKYYNEIQGYNSRLDELQAALLRPKLPLLDQWTTQRRQLAARYLDLLKDKEGWILPPTNLDDNHVYHIFVVRTLIREQVIARMTAAGIGHMIHYPLPPHLQQAYRSLGYQRGDFPLAEAIADTCLSLPLYPGMSEEMVERVVTVITT
jgi:dTDP-4-amino-4,6-dideoxygalactose transaminase